MRGGILRITFDLKPGSLKYQKSILRFRNKLLEDAISYDFKTVRIKENGDLLRIKITLDLHTIAWNGLYWDVMIQLFDPDTERTSLIQILIPPRRRMFMKFMSILITPELPNWHWSIVPANNTMALISF